MLSVASFVELSIVVEARFGAQGVRHLDRFLEPADVNFGECFSYALAESLGKPQLFKGEGFSRTDVARYPPPVA